MSKVLQQAKKFESQQYLLTILSKYCMIDKAVQNRNRNILKV
jgi:hypothetical protein